MKTLNRNRRVFYYSLYLEESVELVDDEGNYTGEFAPVYTTPIEGKGYITAATGSVDIEAFGTNISYDRIIILPGIDTPISESTRLWVDADTTKSHDYVVTRVAKSINGTQIAIKKVNTSA